MKEYLLLFRGGDSRSLQDSPEKWQMHMQKWRQWMGELGAQGKFVGAQPLTNSGKTVSGTNKIVTDGPYMEGKEIVGGYLICKVNSYDEAIDVSKGCPIFEFEDGNVEIREIQELNI